MAKAKKQEQRAYRTMTAADINNIAEIIAAAAQTGRCSADAEQHVKLYMAATGLPAVVPVVPAVPLE